MAWNPFSDIKRSLKEIGGELGGAVKGVGQGAKTVGKGAKKGFQTVFAGDTAKDLYSGGAHSGSKTRGAGADTAARISSQAARDHEREIARMKQRQREREYNTRGEYDPVRTHVSGYQPPTQSQDLHRRGGTAGQGLSARDDPTKLDEFQQGHKGTTTQQDYFRTHVLPMVNRQSRMGVRADDLQAQPPQFNLQALADKRAAGGSGADKTIARRQSQQPVIADYARKQLAAAQQGITVPELEALGGLQSSTTGAHKMAGDLARGKAYSEDYFGGLKGQLGQEGAAESFYSQQLPAVLEGNDYFANKLREDLAKRAAAGGRLSSGYTAQDTGDQMSGMRAKQMREMGDLAKSAQEMQLSRFTKGGELSRGADVSQMARQKQLLDTGEAENKFGLDKARLGINSRIDAEKVKTDRLKLAQESQMKLADIEEQRQVALDKANKTNDENDWRVLRDLDQAARLEKKRRDQIIKDADAADLALKQFGADAAAGAGGEKQTEAEFQRKIATDRDFAERAKQTALQSIREFRDTFSQTTSAAASAEADRNFKTKLTAEMGLSDAMANLMVEFSRQELGLSQQQAAALLESKLVFARAEMAKAGFDADAIEAANGFLRDVLMEGVKGGIKAAGKP